LAGGSVALWVDSWAAEWAARTGETKAVCLVVWRVASWVAQLVGGSVVL
jgi:hypothetical protein